ncbi:MAG: Na+/H+ antiporter NhaC family protein [Lautropia sp.]|nr:Na+/H+ antiporter NhaC family protein [Lautropia sp.]
MFSTKPLMKMPRWEAALVAVLIVVLMGYVIISLGWVPHMAILSAMIGLLVYGMSRGTTYADMQSRMIQTVGQGMSALYLFFFIGLLVTSLMISGAIPTLMYYGFGLISPAYFYFSAFALSSLIGIALGSSLTTCATIGVAFMGMAQAFHADVAMTAGAIVSGAFFGDKMSPISDTTGIAASIVGIDLFEHIRNMMYTTVPAWIISAAVYLWLLPAVSAGELGSVTVFQQQLAGSGLVHLYALLPFVLLLVMALLKVDAIVTLIATIFLALGITYCHSSPSLTELGQWLFKGPVFPDAWGDIAKLLSRGGIESMFFTQTIVILGLSFGGLLFALGVIPALLDGIRHFLTTTGRATFCVALTAVGINALVGEQYLSILLSGETFKPVYERLGLHPRNLSRTLEDAGTVINPLVPWSVCGVFIFNVLGVSVWHYLPYAVFCYMSLVLTLLFGWSGLTLSRISSHA